MNNIRHCSENIPKSYGYEELEELPRKLNFDLHFFEHDAIKYGLLRENIEAGNVRLRDIAMNGVGLGLWYSPQTLRGIYFSYY